MRGERGQMAHESLVAMARARRRAADGRRFGPMPESMRSRLREEVARRAEGHLQIQESLADDTTWWQRFWPRWGVGLVGATIVLAVMAWIVRPGDSPTRLAKSDLGDAVAEAARGVPVAAVSEVAGGFTPPPAAANGADPTPMRDADPPVPGPLLMRSGAPAGVVAAGGGRDSEARAGEFRLAEARRVRRWFEATDESGTNRLVLRRFEVVRAGERVEWREADGSVYSGRVQRLSSVASNGTAPDGAVSGAAAWAFEARGRSRALGQWVLITGTFAGEPAEAGAGGGESSAEEGYLDLPFVGTVGIAETNVIEFRARPVP